MTVLVSSAMGAAAFLAAGMSEPSVTAAAPGGADAVLKDVPISASSAQWTTPFASVMIGVCS